MPRTLAQNATYINETIKPAIKAAIEAQGVTVPSTDSFLDYADRIGEIEGGGSGYQLKDLPTGSISTVNDAAELPLNALKVSVEAVQSGSGIPYPAGGGKNKLPIPTDEAKTLNGITVSVVNGIYTISGKATVIDTEVTFDIMNFVIPTSINQGGMGCFYLFNSFANIDVIAVLYNNTTVIDTWSFTEQNRKTSIYSAMGGQTINKIGIKIRDTNSTLSGSFAPMFTADGTTSATTYIPYSNIRPISGWDSGEIFDKGVNLWDEQWEVGTYNATTGEKEANELIIRSKNYIRINANTKYTTIAGFMELFFYDKNYTYLGNITNGGYQADIQPHEITSLTNAHYMTFRLATQYGTTYNDDISINYPSTDTSYHAYNGKQYTLEFPQTIYGAEWDVVGGTLKQTDGYIASYNGESLPSTWISDRDVYASGTTPTIGAEVVYKLATPTTIDLSPLSIRMLQGVNNVYADCGEVIEGEYFVGETKAYDLVEYIESDGTQVIDTGRQVVQGQTLEITFEGSSNQTAYAWILGGITSSNYYGYQFPNSSAIYLYNGGTSASSQSGFSSDVLTQKALTFNGSANANIHILGLWDGSAYSNQGKFKVYSLDINGDYFVPAKRRSDGVHGLYDVANSTFLTDMASGNPLTGGESLGIRIG